MCRSEELQAVFDGQIDKMCALIDRQLDLLGERYSSENIVGSTPCPPGKNYADCCSRTLCFRVDLVARHTSSLACGRSTRKALCEGHVCARLISKFSPQVNREFTTAFTFRAHANLYQSACGRQRARHGAEPSPQRRTRGLLVAM